MLQKKVGRHSKEFECECNTYLKMIELFSNTTIDTPEAHGKIMKQIFHFSQIISQLTQVVHQKQIERCHSF